MVMAGVGGKPSPKDVTVKKGGENRRVVEQLAKPSADCGFACPRQSGQPQDPTLLRRVPQARMVSQNRIRHTGDMAMVNSEVRSSRHIPSSRLIERASISRPSAVRPPFWGAIDPSPSWLRML